eukprot:Rhum_TRINITY_DN14345_c13_g1::Rhum_TRINITY_DN14345_c13_g1_i1::g.84726::m.84726
MEMADLNRTHTRTLSVDSGGCGMFTVNGGVIAQAKCIDCGQALPSELPYCAATGKEHPTALANGSRCVTVSATSNRQVIGHRRAQPSSPHPGAKGHSAPGSGTALPVPRDSSDTRSERTSREPSVRGASRSALGGGPGSFTSQSFYTLHRRSSAASASMISVDETDIGCQTAIDKGSIADTDDTQSVRMISYNLALRSVKTGGHGMTTRELLANGGCFTDDEISCD